ncbi:MAG: DUF5326 family protein [Streptosporangiales bacterium]|nr:DUF5326 family protein [Streptosporangiales bacterium]MBO0889978.1 DUF5326 family protein [Acidothermales bacterium]
MRTLLLVVLAIIGIFVLGGIVVAALRIAIGVLFYVLIFAAIAAGLVFLVGKIRDMVNR